MALKHKRRTMYYGTHILSSQANARDEEDQIVHAGSRLSAGHTDSYHSKRVLMPSMALRQEAQRVFSTSTNTEDSQPIKPIEVQKIVLRDENID